MGFLLPGADAPVTWRGLMVQKAVQQLLFDVDWRGADAHGPGLDLLVIDMPPGTGDVPLSLGQLVNVDGAIVFFFPCILFLFFFVLMLGFLTLGSYPRLNRRRDRLHTTRRCTCGCSERYCGLSQTFYSRAFPCSLLLALSRSMVLSRQ